MQLAFTENLFAAAIQRAGRKSKEQQELTVTEFFKPKFEDDTKKLIMDYLKGDNRIQGTNFSSYENESPIVVQESYILPFLIKDLAFTQTTHHITQKNLLAITTQDQLYHIDQQMFSPRRPHKESLVVG